MVCKHCHESLPDVSIYCSKCGSPTQEGRSARRDAYAVQPTENVVQLALVSTVMPHTNRVTGNRYRWALAIAVVIVAVFTLTGILSAAILAAAFSVPLVYLLYIYDLNVWEDTPAPVVGLVLILTGVLGVLVSLVFYRWVFEDQFLELTGSTGAGLDTVPVGAFLLFVLLLPVIAEIAMNIGPVLLARLPKFDDMIDGLTFGVAAGTALRGGGDDRRVLVGVHVGRAAHHAGRRELDPGDPQPDDREGAGVRNRHRSRGGRVLRPGRGLRRLHRSLLPRADLRDARASPCTGAGCASWRTPTTASGSG